MQCELHLARKLQNRYIKTSDVSACIKFQIFIAIRYVYNDSAFILCTQTPCFKVLEDTKNDLILYFKDVLDALCILFSGEIVVVALRKRLTFVEICWCSLCAQPSVW